MLSGSPDQLLAHAHSSLPQREAFLFSQYAIIMQVYWISNIFRSSLGEKIDKFVIVHLYGNSVLSFAIAMIETFPSMVRLVDNKYNNQIEHAARSFVFEINPNEQISFHFAYVLSRSPRITDLN